MTWTIIASMTLALAIQCIYQAMQTVSYSVYSDNFSVIFCPVFYYRFGIITEFVCFSCYCCLFCYNYKHDKDVEQLWVVWVSTWNDGVDWPAWEWGILQMWSFLGNNCIIVQAIWITLMGHFAMERVPDPWLRSWISTNC